MGRLDRQRHLRRRDDSPHHPADDSSDDAADHAPHHPADHAPDHASGRLVVRGEVGDDAVAEAVAAAGYRVAP